MSGNQPRERIEALTVGTPSADWSYWLAQGVSYTINPLVLPPILFALVLQHRGASLPEVTSALAAGLVFFAFIPLGYILWLVKLNRVTSIEVYHRENRLRPFLVTIGSYAAALLLTGYAQPAAGPLLTAIIACYIVNAALATLVTLRWKISIHALSLSGFLSILLFVAHTQSTTLELTSWRLEPGFLYALAVTIPLVMWARVRTGSHTPAQVTAGAVCGLIIPYIELSALAAAGWI